MLMVDGFDVEDILLGEETGKGGRFYIVSTAPDIPEVFETDPELLRMLDQHTWINFIFDNSPGLSAIGLSREILGNRARPIL